MIKQFSQSINKNIFIIPWEFSYYLHQALTIKEKKLVESSLYCLGDKQWVHFNQFYPHDDSNNS